VNPRHVSIRVKLAALVVLGMTAMAVAVGGLMFSAANDLLANLAEARLERENERVVNQIEAVADRPGTTLLMARQNPAFDRYFQAVRDEVEAAQAQEDQAQAEEAPDEDASEAESPDESADAAVDSADGAADADQQADDSDDQADQADSADEAPPPTPREAALADIQQVLLYLHQQFEIPEADIVDASGAQIARDVRGALAEDVAAAESNGLKPYFKPSLGLAAGQVYRSGMPYVSDDLKTWVVAYATPLVLADGTHAGVFHVEIPFQSFAERIPQSGDSYSFLLTRDGRLVLHPGLQQATFPVATQWGSDSFRRLAGSMLAGQSGTGTFQQDNQTFHVVYRPVFGGNWIVASVGPDSVVSGPALALLNRTLAVALPLLALAALLTILYSGRLTSRLRRLTTALRSLAAGETEEEPDVAAGPDEIGQLAAAVRDMVAVQANLAGLVEAVASGDLSQEVEPHSDADRLGLALQRMLANLRALVAEVEGALRDVASTTADLGDLSSRTGQAAEHLAEQVQHAALEARSSAVQSGEGTQAMAELAEAIDGLAHGAADQAQQVQAVGASVDQVAADVERVSQRALAMCATSSQTQAAAERGAGAVNEAMAGMAEIKRLVAQATDRVTRLSGLGERIDAMVETIDDIAEQTNLLALNAAIEAARAGEHGRGFAVVADEVQKLAVRSRRETRQIADLIQQIQTGTHDAVAVMQAGTRGVDDGSQRVEQASTALREILDAVGTTVEEVGQIASATEQVALGVRRVELAVESIGAAAEHDTAAITHMATQALHLRGLLEGLTGTTSLENAAEGARAVSGQVERISARAGRLASAAERLQHLVLRLRTRQPGPGVADAPPVQRRAA
jgi:methyl-accepting chemotaxis protein